MQPKNIIVLLIFILLMSASSTAVAQIRANYVDNTPAPIPEKVLEEYRKSIWDNPPAPDGWTNDYEGVFSQTEEQNLINLITKVEARTGIEIALVTVDTNMVWEEKFEEFGEHLLEKWSVGKPGKDNGIVICISSGYKKITISRGAGMEKYLTDAIVTNLIAKSFIPKYKKRDFYGGTLNGLINLINRISPGI